MSRRPRIKGPGLYHHIYIRGNDRQSLFKDRSDYELYRDTLFNYAKKYKIKVIAYALMEWHIHLFIFDSSGQISNFMNVFHGWYAQKFNKVYGRIGHLFEGRFKNKIVDENNYGLWLSRYIHRQPVEAKIVADPKDYEWTSYRVYIGLDMNPLIDSEAILAQFGENKVEQYIAYMKFVSDEEEGPIDWRNIESSSQSFVGDEQFIKKIQKQANQHKDKVEAIEDPLPFLCSYFGVTSRVLLKPCGSEERRLRRQSIVLLKNRCDIGIRELARLFDMAPSSIFAIINKGK